MAVTRVMSGMNLWMNNASSLVAVAVQVVPAAIVPVPRGGSPGDITPTARPSRPALTTKALGSIQSHQRRTVKTQDTLLFAHPDGGPSIPVGPEIQASDAQVHQARRLMRHMAIEMEVGNTKQDRGFYNAFWADSPAVTSIQGRHYHADALWSTEAWELRDDRGGQLRQEHCVPVNVQLPYVRQAIREGRSPREVARFLNSFPVAIITKRQDDELGKELKSKMPDGWDPSKEGAMMARYEGKFTDSKFMTWNQRCPEKPAGVGKLPTYPESNAEASCSFCGQSLPDGGS